MHIYINKEDIHLILPYMLHTTLSLLARVGLINVCSFHFETNTDQKKKYIHSIKLGMVSFLVATGGIFLANSFVIAQTITDSARDSSRVFTKIKNKNNKLQSGYRKGHFPISYEDSKTEQPAGLCSGIISLLEKYLKEKNLVKNGFEIKSQPVPYYNRFQDTRTLSLNPYKVHVPKLDLECGADTIRGDVPGIKFSKPFAVTSTKILIHKNQESLFKDVLRDNQNGNVFNNTVRIGILKNSTTENRVLNFFTPVYDLNLKKFNSIKEALEALEKTEIDGFVFDEILLKGMLKDETVHFAKDYMIYPKEIGKEPYGLVLPADDSEWIKTINNFINEKRPEIEKLVENYFDFGSESEVNWMAIVLIVPEVSLLGLGISWIVLRKPIQPKSFNHGYALLVGVGRCADERLSLPVTVKDVQKLRETLVDPRFCAYPDNDNHIRLLHDEEATRENILNGLDWLKNQTKYEPDATITVYYSGHGALKKSDNRYYLIQHDTDTSCLEETALSAEDFTNKLREIKAKRLLIIIDSCHAAGMATSKKELEKEGQEPLITKIFSGFEETSYPKAFVDSLDNAEGRVVFTSSKGSESSWIRPDKAMSIYTYHLIEGLKGKASKRGDKSIKVSHLMNYLSNKVPESAKELCEAEQNPYFDFATQDFSIALMNKGRKN